MNRNSIQYQEAVAAGFDEEFEVKAHKAAKRSQKRSEPVSEDPWYITGPVEGDMGEPF